MRRGKEEMKGETWAREDGRRNENVRRRSFARKLTVALWLLASWFSKKRWFTAWDRRRTANTSSKRREGRRNCLRRFRSTTWGTTACNLPSWASPIRSINAFPARKRNQIGRIENGIEISSLFSAFPRGTSPDCFFTFFSLLTTTTKLLAMLKLEIMIQFTFRLFRFYSQNVENNRKTGKSVFGRNRSGKSPNCSLLRRQVYDQLNRNWVVMGENSSSTHKSGGMNKSTKASQTRAFESNKLIAIEGDCHFRFTQLEQILLEKVIKNSSTESPHCRWIFIRTTKWKSQH